MKESESALCFSVGSHRRVTYKPTSFQRLWHQLTQSILEFFEKPESAPHQIPLYQKFIADWESKINKLSLVSIVLKAATHCPSTVSHTHIDNSSVQLIICNLGVQESVSFLNEITAKVDTDASKDVYVLALMETAHFKLQLNEYDEVQKAIDESGKILDQFDSVETVIYASFYRVSAEYYKVKAEYAQYYKSALLYLACVNIDDLSDKEKRERAYDLAISALLGEMIYNFGELVSGFTRFLDLANKKLTYFFIFNLVDASDP